MQDRFNSAVTRGNSSVMATNSVIRNTYILLSATVFFSAITAGLAMANNVAPMNPLLFLAGIFGLSFLVRSTSNSSLGIVAVFAFTGFMGFTLGPILNAYMHAFSNGYQLVTTALGGTGVIFLSLSAYALNSKKDFNYLGGFLAAGMVTVLLAIVISLFTNSTALDLMISSAVMLLMAGGILYDTSRIIHGGEKNYINATVSLYMSIFNMLLHLLRILSILAGRRD